MDQMFDIALRLPHRYCQRVCMCVTHCWSQCLTWFSCELHLSGQLQMQWSRIRWSLLTWLTLISKPCFCFFHTHERHKVISQLFHETLTVEKWSGNEECWYACAFVCFELGEGNNSMPGIYSFRYLVNCHVWSFEVSLLYPTYHLK